MVNVGKYATHGPYGKGICGPHNVAILFHSHKHLTWTLEVKHSQRLNIRTRNPGLNIVNSWPLQKGSKSPCRRRICPKIFWLVVSTHLNNISQTQPPTASQPTWLINLCASKVLQTKTTYHQSLNTFPQQLTLQKLTDYRKYLPKQRILP